MLHRSALLARRLSAAVIALCAVGTQVSASADSLDFTATPASDAVSRIETAFHVTLDLRRGLDLRRPVTFSVLDIQQDGALLETVNSLANALNADYRKEFVITAAGNAAASAPVIDASDAPVIFDSETQIASRAIAIVAGVDEAAAQVPPSLSGTVTFSGRKLTEQDAVRQIAAQTHTQWSVAYVLTPHAGRSTPPGKVIGYTSGGQPIVEMPSITFRKPKADPITANEPTQEDLQNPVYISAFMRGDRSAMLKFQHRDNRGGTAVDKTITPPATGAGK